MDIRRSKGERETEEHLRRTVEKERNKEGSKGWNVAKAAAQNRQCWFENVTALCAYWRHERR